MLKITFTLLSLVFFSSAGHSQDYQVDLQDQTLTLPDHPFFITRVIDARVDQSNVGTVQTGMGNSRKMAVMARPLPEELIGFFNRSLPASPGLPPLIVKVLQFTVREKTHSLSEKATAEVSLSFLYQPSPGKYLALCELSSIQESRGMDVTAKHDQNLAAALQDCFLQFSELNFDELVGNATTVLPEELEKGIANTADTLPDAILWDSVVHQGAYRTFREFRDNAPSITQPLSIKRIPRTTRSWQGTDDLYLSTLEANGDKKRLKDVWGFSTGQETYIYYQKDYYLLERLGNGYAFYGRDNASYSVTGAVVGGAVGGLVGAAIGSSFSSRPANSKVKYVLDLVTGKVVEQQSYANWEKLENRGSANLVFYYLDPKSSPDATIALWFTDQRDSVRRDLSVNASLELIWPEVRDSLSAWVSGSPSSRVAFLPEGEQTVYLSCRPRSKSGADGIEVRVVEKKEADFYLKKIRYLQEIAEKRRNK